MMTSSQHNALSLLGCKRSSFTKHGASRSQQRSVPSAVVDALIDFGEDDHDGRGAVRYYFSKRAWRAYRAYLGTEARHYDKYKHAYAVVSAEGSVITTGWRH